AFAEGTFDAPADEEALAALAIDGELVASKRECRAAAVDDAAAENGPAGLVEQIALDRASATGAALVRERHAAVPRSSVEADLRLCKLRSDASAAGIAEVAHGHAALVDGGEGAVDGDLSAVRRLGTCEEKLERLAFVVEAAVREIDARIVETVGVGGEKSRSLQCSPEAGFVESLPEQRAFDSKSACERLLRLDLDDPAHRVAAVLRGERAVHDLDRGDLVRADERPAGRTVVARLEQVVQREAVREDHRAGGLEHVRAADPERCV